MANKTNGWQIVTFILIGVLILGGITGFIVFGKDNGSNSCVSNEPNNLQGFSSALASDSVEVEEITENTLVLQHRNTNNERDYYINIIKRDCSTKDFPTITTTIKGVKIYETSVSSSFCSDDGEFLINIQYFSDTKQKALDKYFNKFYIC